MAIPPLRDFVGLRENEMNLHGQLEDHSNQSTEKVQRIHAIFQTLASTNSEEPNQQDDISPAEFRPRHHPFGDQSRVVPTSIGVRHHSFRTKSALFESQDHPSEFVSSENKSKIPGSSLKSFRRHDEYQDTFWTDSENFENSTTSSRTGNDKTNIDVSILNKENLISFSEGQVVSPYEGIRSSPREFSGQKSFRRVDINLSENNEGKSENEDTEEESILNEDQNNHLVEKAENLQSPTKMRTYRDMNLKDSELIKSQLESRFLRHGTNVHQTWNDAHEKSDSRDELEKSVPLWKPQIDNGPTQNYPSQTAREMTAGEVSALPKPNRASDVPNSENPINGDNSARWDLDDLSAIYETAPIIPKPLKDLDYSDAQLRQLTYQDLSHEDFDYVPHSNDPPSARTLTRSELSENLQAIFEMQNETDLLQQRQNAFSSLSIEQYEQCGDMMMDRMRTIMAKYSAARLRKRNIESTFENEVSSRERDIRAKKGAIDDDLTRLRTAGKDVIRGKKPFP